MLLEIACFNPESAVIAEKSGADRIEFCAEINEGGTTPDLNEFIQLKNSVKIPVYVMIRPRGGDFRYSEKEFEEMKDQILSFKKANADGFVFGILNENNEVDKEKNKILTELAKPFPCTFHRAFDRTGNYRKALEDVIDCGFKTILTSGTKKNVMEGKEMLKELTDLADGRIEILCGGGLRSGNIEEIKNSVKAKYFHSSGIVSGEIADAEEIRKMKRILI